MSFKFSVVGNTKDTKTIRNMSFKNIGMNIFFQSNPSGSTADITLLYLRGVLRRNNIEYTIFDDSVDKLISMMGYFSGDFEGVRMFSTGTLTGGTEYAVELNLNLGQIINLSANDEFILEVRQNNGWSGNTTGSPYITYNIRESIGNGEFIPIWKAQLIQANQSTWSISPGNGIKQIVLGSSGNVNPHIISSQIYTNARIESDKLDIDESVNDLIGRIYGDFEYAATGAFRYQNFGFGFSVPLNNCSILVNLRAGNVTGTNCWIGYMQALLTKETAEAWAIREEKHNRKNVAFAMQQIG